MNKFFSTAILLLLGLLTSAQKAEKGVLDLSNADLKDSFHELSGEWEFYWNELADPSSLDKIGTDYFSFPALWKDGVTAGGEELTSEGYATYRLKVIMPPPSRLPDLAISISEMYTSYRLFYNGFEIAKNGRVGTTKETTSEDWLPHTLTIGRFSDTLEFVLQIANFRHIKGGSREPIIIGDRKKLAAQRDFNFSYDFLLSGSLIMGGLFFLGLFLFGQHERSVLYFALFCITFSYRMVGSGEYALHALYPDMSWEFILRTEYLALFIPTGIFAVYSYLLYPKDAHKSILLGVTGIALVFSLAAIFTPPIFFTRLVETYLLVITLTIFYLVYLYWVAFKRRRLGAEYALGSTGIVFLVAMYLILIYLTPTRENTLLTFCGFILFFFFQSLILSFRFAASLKQAKEEAEAASKAKTDFLSTISHEIRTPLNAVVGISHFLMNDKPRKNQVESLESLKFSAENLTTIINDILDYNKLESGSIEFEMSEVNLKDLARKIISFHTPNAKAKGIDLIFDFDEKIHETVLADSTRIYQVVNNLIHNAIKFTSKGFVKLKIELVHKNTKSQKVRCLVSDSGIGIPREKQALIFERFTQAGSSTTREYGGTGLGLAIIKRILNLAGSEINVVSEEGKGAVFSFELSFSKVKRSPKPTIYEDTLANKKLKGKKILLVEDNQMNIMVASKFLHKWELKVDVAMNGQEGVEKVLNNKYDLVLMDLQMPILDGYQATRQIRETNKKIPIIALTASALLRVRKEVHAAGMNDYITKPFDPKELKRKIVYQLTRAKFSH
ncbi:MAG: response regulator [Cyclobacteriaceae bacterium]